MKTQMSSMKFDNGSKSATGSAKFVSVCPLVSPQNCIVSQGHRSKGQGHSCKSVKKSYSAISGKIVRPEVQNFGHFISGSVRRNTSFHKVIRSVVKVTVTRTWKLRVRLWNSITNEKVQPEVRKVGQFVPWSVHNSVYFLKVIGRKVKVTTVKVSKSPILL